jgi:fructose-bisphosphate aldolase, class I
MKTTVAELLSPGKGILAADESLPSIAKRFKPYQIPDTEENHRAYRDMLFTTPGLNEFISGVILFDETIRHIAAGQAALHHRARCNSLALRGKYSSAVEGAAAKG